MPAFRNYSRHRKTPRENILEELTRLELQLFLDPSEGDSFEVTPLFLKVLITKHFFLTNRYLNPREPVFKSSIFRDEVLSMDNGMVFQEALRLSPEQFNYVVKLIQDHPIFQQTGKKPQKEVTIQLKVALHRLAHDGSLSSFKAIARVMGITTGSVVKYTHRVIEALCSLITKFVSWPDAEAKAKIKAHYARTGSAGFGDVLGSIDGTLIPLYR
ncbi:hypothetical protein BGZ99_003613, partial [Dissophora globulifera]